MKRLIIKYRELPFHKALDKFALSELSFALQFFAACVFVLLNEQINGVAFFGFVGAGMLLLCSDLLSICMPLLLCSVFATALYDSADEFLSFIVPEGIFIVLCVLFHFVVYEKKFTLGKSFYPLLAVSFAVTLSGIGSLTLPELLKPSALYYTFFLGFGLLLIYLVINAYYKESRDYDIYKKFAIIMYVMGIFAAFNVFSYYIDTLYTFFLKPELVNFQASNNLSTFLLFAMPFPFYFSLKGSKLHLFSGLLMFGAILLAGSGGGLLMGSILFFVCLAFIAVYDKKYRILWIALTVFGIASFICIFGYILSVYGFETLKELFTSNLSRVQLLERSFEDFKSHPIFGVGLTYRGNTDIYNPKDGAMTWYHMMGPQIWGSMGILGILAYGFLFIKRGLLVIKARRDALSMTLFLSYFGLFLMSQVNPGEFCPIPYALLAILIFTFIERKPMDIDIKRNKNSKRNKSNKRKQITNN